MKPYLALFRAGPQGLGLEALECLQSQDFDFALCWAGSAPPAVPGAIFVHAGDGPRWPALARALAAHEALVARYRYVFMPDDSVQCTPQDIARLFAICEHLGLDLAQPAFTPASRCAQTIALQHSEFQVRFTNCIDAAAPVFSLEMLARVMPMLEGAHDDGLFGRVWPRLTRLGRVAVVDATPVGRVGAAAPGSAGGASSTAAVTAFSHFVDPADDAAINLGGLLGSGDALCLSERAADVDALLEALMRSCRGLGLDASHFTRYLARHLDFAGTDGLLAANGARAAIRIALERELAGAEMKFNRVVAPSPDAAAAAPSLEPARDEPAADTSQAAADAAAQIEQLTRALALARRAGEPDIARQLALREADLRDLRERYAAIIAERDRQSALLAELATQLTRAHRSVRQLVPAPAAAVPAMEAR